MRKIVAGAALAVMLLPAAHAFAQATGGSFPTPSGQPVSGTMLLVPCGSIVNGQPAACPPGLANALPVTIVGGGLAGGVNSVSSNPVNGTIAATNTFQTLLAQNSSRKGCRFQNQGTHTMFVSDQASSTLAGSFQVAASGGIFDCANAAGIVRSDQLKITGTAGDAFAGDWQ